jgi:hypothetical protein
VPVPPAVERSFHEASPTRKAIQQQLPNNRAEWWLRIGLDRETAANAAEVILVEQVGAAILAEGDNECLKRCGSAEVQNPLVKSTAIRRCRRIAKSIVAVSWWCGLIPCVSCGQRR